MKESIFKRVFRTKTFYILFSVIAAIALWTYVEYSENLDVNVSVSGIPVSFENEQKLTESNLIITDIDTQKLNIRFTGKRNTVAALNNNNVTATVDLSEIARAGVAGVYQLNYELEYPSGTNVNTISAISPNMSFTTVTVERLITRNIEIIGINDCDVAEGYQAEPMELASSAVAVSGPESLVDLVDHATVVLNKDDVSQTVTEELEIRLVDTSGLQITNEGLTMSQSTVSVTMPIKMVKEVSLSVNLLNAASATDRNSVVRISPKTITLSGDPEVLEDMNEIVLENVDLASFAGTYSETVNIRLPNGVDNLSGETTANVSVEIIGRATKRLSANNISCKNLTEGYTASVITQSLDITLRGMESDLEQINASNIRIVADLTDLGNTTGTFSVAAKVSVDGFKNVDAIGSYTVTVALTEEQN